MEKAYKFRMYPNKKQEELINKTLSLFKGLKDPHAKAEARQEIEKMLSAVNSYDLIALIFV